MSDAAANGRCSPAAGEPEARSLPRVVLVDVDGTLVDTNYQHAIAWYCAFRSYGIVLPVWQIHRHIGMGGDNMVGALTDHAVEESHGDAIRGAERVFYMERIDQVEPFEGARDLIVDLDRRGHAVLLVSSARQQEVDHYIDLLGARSLLSGWTTADDVRATKPEPDLVRAALERGGASPEEAVIIGDSPWDVESARRAGVRAVGVLTGGFARQELLDAGAERVHESVQSLRRALAGSDRAPSPAPGGESPD